MIYVLYKLKTNRQSIRREKKCADSVFRLVINSNFEKNNVSKIQIAYFTYSKNTTVNFCIVNAINQNQVTK